MKVSVCLPTYNEAETIVNTITGVLSNFRKMGGAVEAVVVDDNSPDGTAKLVKSTFFNEPNVKCIVRTEERGFPTAVKTFIENSTGDHILFMDADGNHDPNYIPIFLSLAPYYDAICGSRFSWGGGMEGPQFRYWGSYYFNLITRFFLGLKSRDNTSGYLLFKRSMLEGLDLTKIFQGYGEYFFILLYHFKKSGFSFIDIPVKYLMRTGGESKTKFLTNVLRYFWIIFLMKIGRFNIYRNEKNK
ncbi:MAG: glycosyltransferase [Parcubacteria group bacterium]|nr:glycosyltransferase [Parcubacteria group bacterium]